MCKACARKIHWFLTKNAFVVRSLLIFMHRVDSLRTEIRKKLEHVFKARKIFAGSLRTKICKKNMDLFSRCGMYLQTRCGPNFIKKWRWPKHSCRLVAHWIRTKIAPRPCLQCWLRDAMVWDVSRFTNNAHFSNFWLYASPANIGLGGIGGGWLHACLMYSVGVYYENTGIENPMFLTRDRSLLIIQIFVFALVVSAPRLSTLAASQTSQGCIA